MIDVGGPALIRAAAKNHARVAVVVEPGGLRGPPRGDPRDGRHDARDARAPGGPGVRAHGGLRRRDRAATLASSRAGARPSPRTSSSPSSASARCATARTRTSARRSTAIPSAPADALVRFEMLQGKELSFNNLLDLDSAVALARDFDGPAAVIVKHNNPCGAADRRDDRRGLRARLRVRSAGGVRRHHRDPRPRGRRARVARAAALRRGRRGRRLHAGGASTSSRKKPNIRLLQGAASRAGRPGRSTGSGSRAGCSSRTPTPSPTRRSAWQRRLAAQADRRRAGGVRARLEGRRAASSRTRSCSPTPARRSASAPGQMSRVDACRLAATKPVLPIVNCGAASDAFFPFRDGLDILAEAGVTAVVAPGGSIRDQEIIAAADERQMAFLHGAAPPLPALSESRDRDRLVLSRDRLSCAALGLPIARQPRSPPPIPRRRRSAAARDSARRGALRRRRRRTSRAFTQIYTPAGFATARRESGTVWIQAPQRLRFDYAAPEKKIFTYDAGEGRFFSPGGQAAHDPQALAGRAGAPADRLPRQARGARPPVRDHAEPDEAGSRLLLKPRAPRTRPRLAAPRRSPRTGWSTSLAYEDSAGNRTRVPLRGWRNDKAAARRRLPDHRTAGHPDRRELTRRSRVIPSEAKRSLEGRHDRLGSSRGPSG